MTAGLLLLVLLRRLSAIGSVPIMTPVSDRDDAMYLDAILGPAIALKSLLTGDTFDAPQIEEV